MKISLTVILSIIIIVSSFNVFSQQAKYIDAYNDGKFDKCLQLCEKAKSKDSNDLNALMYEAMAWCELSKIPDSAPEYKTEYKRALDKALRSISAFKKKDKTNAFLNKNKQNYEIVRKALLDKGNAYAEEGDFQIVKTYYENLLNNLNDARDYFYIGLSYIKCNEYHYGVSYVNKGLKEYYKEFQKGEKQDSAFYNRLVELGFLLGRQNFYAHAFRIYTFIHLLYPDERSKTGTFHLQLLENATGSCFYISGLAREIIRESTIAYKYYNNDAAFISPIRNCIINYTNELDSMHSKNGDSYIYLDSLYQFAIDSTQQVADFKTTINEILIKNIFSNFVSAEPVSKLFYKEYLKINQHHTNIKPEEIAGKLINEYTSDLKKEGYAIILMRDEMGKSKLPKDLIMKYEKILVKEFKKYQSNYSQIAEVYFWQAKFPEMKDIESFAKDYYIRMIRKNMDKNDFSRTEVLLINALKYFPADKTIADLKREFVNKDYEQNYLRSEFTIDELAWTGSVENCIPGEISQLAQQKTLQRLNFFRRMAGIPDFCEFDTTKNRYCQAASLCMKAQGELSHNPTSEWKCYSEDAYMGASHSNLGSGTSTSYCIDNQIEDAGENNKEVGHRTWLLTADKQMYAYGATNNSNAIWTIYNGGTFPDSVMGRYNNEWTTWPPAGPVPENLVFYRWSLVVFDSKFSFKNPRIKMTLNGSEIPFEIEYQSVNKLVWWPKLPDVENNKEQHVKVTILLDVNKWGENWEQISEERKFNYEVIIYKN